jgi:YHS domain-containing protein
MKAVDPVCGMQLDMERTAIRSEYRGQTYYFCKSACQRAFDARPENYITQGTSQTVHGSQEHALDH